MQRRKFLALAGAATIAPVLPAPAIDTLAGYAEGVFTPAVDFDYPSAASLVYTGKPGAYYKVGNWVACSMRVRWSRPEDPNTWEPSPVANAK